MNETSTTIAEIAKALCKAQGEMKNAPKDTVNPFFKSHYADLAACWDALRPVLSKHGLSVTQYTLAKNEGTELVTLLLHTSGEWIRGTYPINPKDSSPQALGSALTFGKRYALQAITGLASEDDDGNAAQGGYSKEAQGPRTSGPLAGTKAVGGMLSPAQINRLWAIASKSNWDKIEVTEYLKKIGLESVTELSKTQYDALCGSMEKYPHQLKVVQKDKTSSRVDA